MGTRMERAGAAASGMLRGIALALGVFALVSLGASWVRGGGDANVWWVDASSLPGWVADGLIALGGLCLMAWSMRPGAGLIRRILSAAVLGVLAAVAVQNAAVFYQLWAHRVIRSAVPVPVSLLVAGLLVVILWRMVWPGEAKGHFTLRWLGVVLGIGAFGVLFPLAQIMLYGQTDYRRKADAIVVLGAKVHADGHASQALADRVRTGVELYKERWAPLIIMSGGPGEGTTHETVAMEQLAVKWGVPRSAIVRDEQGLNTAATMRNMRAMAKERGFQRVLAVSHSWHLPRIKLAAGRGEVMVYTVPCTETRTLAGTPMFVAREVVAFWKYYAMDVLGI